MKIVIIGGIAGGMSTAFKAIRENPDLDIEGIDSTNVYTVTKPYIVKDLKDNLNNYKNIAIVGGGFITTCLTESQAKDLGYDYAIAESEISNKPGYMPESNKLDFRLIYESTSYKLLGARIFGQKDAVLRLLPFSTAIHANLTTKDLAYYDYAYAPPFSLTWEAVNIASSAAK